MIASVRYVEPCQDCPQGRVQAITCNGDVSAPG